VTDGPATYFMITHSDGDVCVHQLTMEEAIAHLAVDEETGELLHQPLQPGEKFDSDPNYWPAGRHLIIRGEVVTPTPVIARYEFL
jgi:hypothetical protein